MASDLDDLAEPERRLCEILAAYFEAVKAGNAPERGAWLAQYPELAGQLIAFLDEQDRLLRVTGPLRLIAQDAVGGAAPMAIAGKARGVRLTATGRTKTKRVLRSADSATTSSWASQHPVV